jgi:hypothetical protein
MGSDLGSPSRIANHASLHQKHSTNPKRQMPRKLQEQKSLRALMHATKHFTKSPRGSPQARFRVLAEDPDEEYFTSATMQASEVCPSPAMTGFQKFKQQDTSFRQPQQLLGKTNSVSGMLDPQQTSQIFAKQHQLFVSNHQSGGQAASQVTAGFMGAS